MIEIGARAQHLPAPPVVVFESLSHPHRRGARPWLDLVEGEVDPRVLVAEPLSRVVWSSLWPDRPDDEIHFGIEAHQQGARLGFRLLTPGEMPGAGETGRLRFRLNKILFGDLRLSYGQ